MAWASVHGDSTFDGVITETPTGASAEDGLVVLTASFVQPGLENGGGRGRERDAALLSAFSVRAFRLRSSFHGIVLDAVRFDTLAGCGPEADTCPAWQQDASGDLYE